MITPNGKKEDITSTAEYHDSQWQRHRLLSGLNGDKYSENQKMLIAGLIQLNEWIEEEGSDLKGIIRRLD